MNASRSSPRVQSGALHAAADDLARAGGLVDADQLLDRERDGPLVELVGDRVVDDRVAVGVDLDPAVAALARDAR